LATIVPSSTKTNTYGWLSAMPQWRQFVGERRYKSFAELVYVLINLPWEKSAEIPIDDVADDNLGIWKNIVERWNSDGGSELIEIQVAAAMQVGHTTGLCYDAQPFFSTSHPIGDSGAVFSNRSGDGSGNAWYLLVMGKEVNPFMYQERQAPEFNMVTNPEDSYVFKNRKIPMGSFARGVSGYTFPQYAHRCDGPIDPTHYAAAFLAITTLTDEEGRPLGLKPTHLVYGATNRAAAKTMIDAQNQAGGASNIYWKDVELVDGSTRLP
jgi:phage major head subunit gpT-like protein